MREHYLTNMQISNQRAYHIAMLMLLYSNLLDKRATLDDEVDPMYLKISDELEALEYAIRVLREQDQSSQDQIVETS